MGDISVAHIELSDLYINNYMPTIDVRTCFENHNQMSALTKHIYSLNRKKEREEIKEKRDEEEKLE